MAKISANDESSTPVLDWDKEERILHVTDPFFAFYLRWGQLTIQPSHSIPFDLWGQVHVPHGDS